MIKLFYEQNLFDKQTLYILIDERKSVRNGTLDNSLDEQNEQSNIIHNSINYHYFLDQSYLWNPYLLNISMYALVQKLSKT